MQIKILEYTGTMLAVLGALLLATQYSPFYGYVLFLASGLFLIPHAYFLALRGLFIMQTVFLVINIIGFLTRY